MAYFQPYIDSSGIVLPTFEDIKTHLIDKMKEIYGNDIYLENDSQDYQMISAIALMIYDANQLALYVYNSNNPITATGASLDRLVALNGITRKEASFSTALLTITGNAGTELNYCSARDVNGNLWQLETEIVISESGTINALASCLKPGSIQAAANTINIIATPTSGWTSVNNPSPAIPGSPVEADSELKARRQASVSLPSMAVFEGIAADIKQLHGVSKVMAYENDTGNTVDTIPPHNIAIVVEGGEEHDIANIIYMRKTPGTGTFGTTSVSVLGDLQIENIIRFSRPSNVALSINVSIKKLPTWADDLTEVIKQNLVEYVQKMNIGEDLYVANLNTPIILANPDMSKIGFYISSIVVNSQLEVVNIGKFEVASLDISNISVTAI